MTASVVVALFGGSMWAIGFTMGRISSQRRPSVKHEHIWDVWQHCELNDYVFVRGERVHTLVKGQMRDCLSCGERDVREVSA